MSRPDLIPTSSIESIRFLPTNDENILRDSHVNVTNKNLFQNDGTPYPTSIYSSKFGTIDQLYNCTTCGLDKNLCLGHDGHIEVNYFLPQPLAFVDIRKWLTITCFECGSCIISSSKLLGLPPKERLTKANALAVAKQGNRLKKPCPVCDAMHPIVAKNPTSIYMFLTTEVDTNGNIISDPKTLMTHTTHGIFSRITDETVAMLGVPFESHPKNYIITRIKVPPINVRPTVKRIGGTNGSNDSLTVILQQIFKLSEKLKGVVSEDKIIEETKTINDMTDFYFSLIKESKSTGKSNSKDEHKSMGLRIKGKTGLVRNNILGKRVASSGRSTIAQNPTLKPWEVSIPLSFARKFQREEVVQEYNIHILNIYFQNGLKKYPGCSQVIKRSNGRVLGSNAPNLILEIGDTILRDYINGDIITINRPPSLFASNITAMECIVNEDPNVYTIDFNVIDCSLFNADFDGDAMTILANSKSWSCWELSQLSTIDNWFIEYATSSPKIGQSCDAVAGLYMLTMSDTRLTRDAAMSLFARCICKPVFEDRIYTGRELVSMTMKNTPISMTSKTTYYDAYENLRMYIDYNPDDIEVEIVAGNLIRGVLDKHSIGEKSMNGLYHQIMIEYGPRKALEVVYDQQQLAINFTLLRGLTLGIIDIILPKVAYEEINAISASMINKSNLLTDKLNKGELVPPIGKTIDEFYEAQQIQFLQAFDEFDGPIMKNMNARSNNFLKLILSGCKGKIDQLRNISATNGQKVINGDRLALNFGIGRSLPYFCRYSTDPTSRGYIPGSYIGGFDSIGMISGSMNARFDLIARSLMTGVTGYQNRKSIKNLESIIADNYRGCIKGSNILQFAYGEDMTDARHIYPVKIPTILIGDKKFNTIYNGSQNSSEKSSLYLDEFEAIKADRIKYRALYMTVERIDSKYVMDNKRLLSVDVDKIINSILNTINITKDVSKSHQTNKSTSKELDLMVKTIKTFVDDFGYCLMNDIQRALRTKIPKHISNIVWLTQMCIRAALCSNELVKHKITPQILGVILETIKLKYIKSLVAPGMCVGTIAAQSFSEPLTQYMLDATHRSASGGTSKTHMIKVTEILAARPLEKLIEPKMSFEVLPIYANSRIKVQEIANQIESMYLKQFVTNWQLFFEPYGKSVHSEYKHENSIIANYDKLMMDLSKSPRSMIDWCVRFTIDKSNMIVKNINIETIVRQMRKKYKTIHIVYTTENKGVVFIRVYFTSAHFDLIPTIDMMLAEKDMLLDLLVRGVNNIISATVEPLIKSRVTDDGAIEQVVDQYMISTVGINFELMMNPNIIAETVMCDAIQEIARMFGIAAARQAIIYRLNTMSEGKCGYKHLSIYADEMTFNGNVTSVEQSGMKKRMTSGALLEVGFGSPLQVLSAAMLNTTKNDIEGITAGFIMGSIPKVGTCYNSYVMNSDLIKANVKSNDSYLDDL